VSKLVLPELLNDVNIPVQSVTDTILLAESQRYAAAGTAIAYRVVITPAFDNCLDKPSPVAITQDFSGFLFGYLTGIVWHCFREDVTSGSEQYLHVNRVIAIPEDVPAGTWSHSYSFSAGYYFLGIIG